MAYAPMPYGCLGAIWDILYYKDDSYASHGTGVMTGVNRILTCHHGITSDVISIRARLVVDTNLEEHIVELEYGRPEWDLAILKFSDPFVRFDSILRLSRNQVLSVGKDLFVIGNESGALGKITRINVGFPCQVINPSTFNDMNNYVHNPDEFNVLPKTREYQLMGDISSASKIYHPNLPVIRYLPSGIYFGRSGGPLVRKNGRIVGIHTHSSPNGFQVAVHLSTVRFFLSEASKQRQEKSRLIYLRFRMLCAFVKRKKISYKMLNEYADLMER